LARVRFVEEAVLSGELTTVPRAQLVEAVRRIRDTPDCGKPLRGRLFGCRSIRVGGSENRLVYYERAEQDEVIVLALGRRRDDAVHNTAAGRRPGSA
jgi:plasmid stabilization system protein ParE